MRILENEFLKISVADFGAELSSVYDKEKAHEIIWTADPKYWARHAPVLFPFVGKVNGGFYTHEGVKYPMGQHGFARDNEFKFIEGDKNHTLHSFKSNEKTKKIYPFDFELKITHTLEGKTVKVKWEVINIGNSLMYFSIGGHPAFNCPVDSGFKKSDYYVDLGKDSLEYVLIDSRTESVDYKNPHKIGGLIKLSEELFDNDALIFDNSQVERAVLFYPDKTPYVTLDCKGFPSFGLWSKPKSGAPFVCLEPWIGRCDNMGFEGELKDKYGERCLAPQKSFTAEFSITVG